MVTKWTVPLDEWMEQNATEDREVSLEDVPTVTEPVPAVLDTLVFAPDEGIFYEVFRGVCALTGLDEPEVARITITI
jgi:hypothetical protein